MKVLVLLQPKWKSYVRKSADWFSPTIYKHWEEHDLILYFHFLFKLTKTEVLIYRDVDVDSQTYPYKNVLQTYAANLHEGPCCGFPLHHWLRCLVFPYFWNFCLFFASAKEPSSDVTTFLNMRLITTQKPAFWENITC